MGGGHGVSPSFPGPRAVPGHPTGTRVPRTGTRALTGTATGTGTGTGTGTRLPVVGRLARAR
ncbi:hypothetical protein ADL09_06370, partial [Streptomyces sp. NRRL F-7442]